MRLLDFHAYLRVSGTTVSYPKAAGNITQFSQLAVAKDRNNESRYALTFYPYKHSFSQRHFTLTIQKSHNSCPVDYLRRYIALRGNRSGPLFMLSHHTVTRIQFCTWLRDALRVCGHDPARYTGHSVRIRAASHTAPIRLSDA